jgi:hypothetical protein
MNGTTFSGGDTVTGTIETSTNIAAVEAMIGTWGIPIPRVAPGRFALRYVVPNVPFFWHQTFTLKVIARNTAGDEATREVPITIR